MKMFRQIFQKKKKPFPKRVMIQTSSYCNARCVICPYPKVKDTLSMGYMADDLFKKIIDELSQHDITSIMLYLMNEPLTDPKLIKRIHYAKRKCPFAHVYFLTNGSLLTPKLSKAILESPLDEIVFSILGFEKTYEQLMGLDFRKTYQKIQDFVTLSKQYSKPAGYIGIKLTQTPDQSTNEENKAFRSFWRKQGVQNIDIIKAPISRAGNMQEIRSVDNESMIDCGGMWEKEMIEILYTGQVVLCCMDWKRTTNLGNVSKQTLKNIWNSKNHKYYKKLMTSQKQLPSDFICRHCELIRKGE